MVFFTETKDVESAGMPQNMSSFEMSTPKLATSWSPEKLVANLGGNEALAAEIVSLFLIDGQQILNNLELADREQDVKALALWAHSLKGAAAFVNATVLYEQARTLERLIHSKSVLAVTPLVGDIKTAFLDFKTQCLGVLENSCELRQ